MQVPFQIDFPKYDLRFRAEKGRRTVFDIIRKKYVALTPEEMVRQHLLHYLTTERQYPGSLLAIEKSLKYNTMSRRCDIVAYHQSGKAAMIVECKAPEVALDQSVFDQAARYNEVLKVLYLVICNGHECFCARINFETNQITFEQEIPLYSALEKF